MNLRNQEKIRIIHWHVFEFYFVPNAVLSQMFLTFLLLEDISRFDNAICNKNRRLKYLKCIKSKSRVFLGDKDRNFSSQNLCWLQSRSIRIRHLKFSQFTDALAVNIGSLGSNLNWLSITDAERKDFGRKKCLITDIGIEGLVEKSPNLHTLDISGCSLMTHVGIATLAEGLPNLRSLD
jgi:hypothetical protein